MRDRIRNSLFAIAIVAMFCCCQSSAATYSATGSQTNLRIPTNGAGGSGNSGDFTRSTISVSGVALNQIIDDVDVTLSLTHSYDADLVMTLIAPDGRRVLLASQQGGSGNNYTNTTFDDQAALSIYQGSPPFSGSFRPEQTLNQLAGMSPNGFWTLEIQDIAPPDVGTLSGWSLTIAVPEPGSLSLVIAMLGVVGFRRRRSVYLKR